MLQFDLSGPLTCTGGEEVGGRDDLGRCGQRVHHQGGFVEDHVLCRECGVQVYCILFFEMFHVLYLISMSIHLIITHH